MIIVGIDEVGRGCWAGPLVAGAAVLNTPVKGLKDSKKLSAKQRLKLAGLLKDAANYGLGWVWPREIDQLGLTKAVTLAMVRAVNALSKEAGKLDVTTTNIIIDGNYNYLPDLSNVTIMIKADNLVPAVSAASILAKVARDTYMQKLAVKVPEYGFDKHVGYGTKAHQQALAKHGPSPYHRHSYKPVKLSSNTFDVGRQAEQAACDYLITNGFEVVDRNWRTKFCEIDIVAARDKEIYFVEVKYRQDNTNGTGIDYITPVKLRQMSRSAEAWTQKHKWPGDYCLAIIAVGGSRFRVEDMIILDDV